MLYEGIDDHVLVMQINGKRGLVGNKNVLHENSMPIVRAGQKRVRLTRRINIK